MHTYKLFSLDLDSKLIFFLQLDGKYRVFPEKSETVDSKRSRKILSFLSGRAISLSLELSGTTDLTDIFIGYLKIKKKNFTKKSLSLFERKYYTVSYLYPSNFTNQSRQTNLWLELSLVGAFSQSRVLREAKIYRVVLLAPLMALTYPGPPPTTTTKNMYSAHK